MPRMKLRAELLNVRPAEIPIFIHFWFSSERTQELHAQLLADALPV